MQRIAAHSLVMILSLFLIWGCGESETREGDKYYQRGNYEQAIKAYSDFLKYNPKHVKTLYNRGRSYEEVGEIDKALNDFKSVLDVDPNHQPALMSMGKHAYREGDFENAAYLFGQAVAAGSGKERRPEPFVWKGRSLIQQGMFSEAIAELSKAVSIDDDFADAYFYRGIAKFNRGNEADGCQDMRTAEAKGHEDALSLLSEYCK